MSADYQSHIRLITPNWYLNLVTSFIVSSVPIQFLTVLLHLLALQMTTPHKEEAAAHHWGQECLLVAPVEGCSSFRNAPAHTYAHEVYDLWTSCLKTQTSLLVIILVLLCGNNILCWMTWNWEKKFKLLVEVLECCCGSRWFFLWVNSCLC
jgi:hypothetical protein